MVTDNEKTSLKKERGKTDESLISERGKTDDSFADYRKKTESETNKKVKSDRQDADDLRHSNRVEADATTNSARVAADDTSKTKILEERNADECLDDQRKSDDAAVSSERSLMDAALLHERNVLEKKANKSLHDERLQTDKNLLRERTLTDEDALTSSTQLAHEQTSHVATKAALTTRDEFLAIVSHDLRNPISAVRSYASLLLEDGPKRQEDVKAWAEVIQRNADSALRLISDILDMERSAAGKLKMEFGAADISALLREVALSHKYAAAKKAIKLEIENVGTARSVRCDRDRIIQILNNLVGNALKFTPSEGSVTLAASFGAEGVTISVTDTGPGIPVDQQKKVFERYTQIGNMDRSGLGLGLYIASMLVDAHGADLRVSSLASSGTTFCFTLRC